MKFERCSGLGRSGIGTRANTAHIAPAWTAAAAVTRRVDPSTSIRSMALCFAARAATNEIGNPPLGKNVPVDVEDGMDPMAGARAAAAAQAVMAGYEGQIAAVMADRSMTPEQRKAAIAALRAKAKKEAAEASKRIMEAATGAAKMLRRMQCAIG